MSPTINDSYVLEYVPFPHLYLSPELITTVIGVAVAIVLNLLFLCSLSTSKSSNLRTFLLNLVLADLFICFFTAGVELGWRLTVTWRAGEFGCRFFSCMKTFGIYAQSFVVVAASTNHLHVTSRPFSDEEEIFRCKTLHAMAWLAAIVFSVPQALVFHIEMDPENPAHIQCVTLNSLSANAQIIYVTTGLLAAYFLPIVMVITVHSIVLWRIAKRKRTCRITVNVTKDISGSCLTDDSHEIELEPDESVTGASVRPEIQEVFRTYAIRLSVVIMVSFVIFATPYAALVVFNAMYSNVETGNVDLAEHDFSQLLDGLLNLFLILAALLNPVIYGLFFFHAKRSYGMHLRA